MTVMFIVHFISSKATETAQQLKKTAGVPFHSKGRGLVKKIDTTSKIYIYIYIFTHTVTPKNIWMVKMYYCHDNHINAWV